ncbi:hypothetical protein K466DRAFT_642950 [Polyporus arcularius HHB13444]|uniref:AN1-type domain-containing protein n=1 Tax=Polyporus arcularius HHB13444 TaxID=1314778 RepID=A0A5C3PWN1_9APHY|nr:hypothetical protein K466DRAFT_642950 [Polyporus arcularius HHB13444]
MSDGLPAVGAHCSLSSCNLNDFLPIRCKCQQLFCRDHIAPDVHHCPLQQATQCTDAPSSKLQRCAAQGCNKPSLESFIANPTDIINRSPAVCSGCSQAYCAQHREPSSHACTPPPDSAQSVPEKNAAAKALLAKHFGSTTSGDTGGARTSTTKASNPKKEAQQRQIAAMKMRHKAQPGDPKDTAASVPVDQRLHLKVSRTGVAGSERIFWFRKTIVTGRALDMLATHFRMTISDTQPLKLLLVDGEAAGTALRTDQPLGDQVPDGSSLTLSR